MNCDILAGDMRSTPKSRAKELRREKSTRPPHRVEYSYLSEEQLVQDFTSSLLSAKSPFDCQKLMPEFPHQSGRTDVIGLRPSGDVISFEAKLKNWRKALHQAFRNTAYAHLSYVVLPSKSAKSALLYRHEFVERGVGLVAVTGKRITTRISARKMIPLLPWVTEKAKESVTHYNG